MSEHLDFVHKMTKLALDHQEKMQGPQHLDDGGTVNASSTGGSLLTGPQQISTGSPNPGTGLLGGAANFLGLQNAYQPAGTAITPGTNTGQLNTAYTGSQGALTQNQGIANTLNPGVTQGAGAESALSGQLATEAAGGGPNPALSELNQATGQNTAQTAALLASQRGAGTNAGFIGEQGARLGAANQQASAGQAATLSAQQQLAAQTAATNLAATQVNQGQNAAQSVSQQQQGEQATLQGANTAANNSAVTAQGSLNNTNASIAGSNAAANATLLGGGAAGLSAAAPLIGRGLSAIGGLFAHGGLVRMDRGGNVLDANARKHISKDNFALPGGRYPIHDAPHARNALARVSQYGTPAEKARVKAAVTKKYPDMMVQKSSISAATQKGSSSAATQNKADGGTIDPPEIGNDQPNLGMTDCKPRPDAGYGAVKCLAAGGPIEANPLSVPQGSQPLSFVGQWLNSGGGQAASTGGPAISSAPDMAESPSSADQLSALGKSLNPSPSSASSYVAPDSNVGAIAPGEELAGGADASTAGTAAASGAADAGLADLVAVVAAKGGSIPGKPEVDHDDLKNDKVPAMLTPGEVVIDLDTMKDKGTVGKMARALAAHIEKRNKGGRA